MTDARDERLGALLRQHAPAARDPFFRLRVLGRREHQLHQRCMLEMTVLAIAALAAVAATATIGAGLLEAAGCLLLVVGFTAVFKHSAVAFRRGPAA